MDQLEVSTTWVTGHVARYKDSIQARLELDDNGLEASCVLSAYWQEPELKVLDVQLTA